MNVAPLMHFIVEREAIREKRARGEPWPWTDDPVLRTYRFCNVRRNDDRQTQLIHANWLQPFNEDADLWFAMVVARLINWWPSLNAVGYPVPWNRRRFKSELAKRKAAGEKVFTGAYMVRADATLTGRKADYLADFVLQPMWDDREKIRPRGGDTLASFHARLVQYRDMGSFMAAQVVADTKYAQNPLSSASDWGAWAASGPGSRRGLNRVLGRELNAPWKEYDWFCEFQELRRVVTPLLREAKIGYLTGQDLQNCLCETDKYMRGSSRSKYVQQENP